MPGLYFLLLQLVKVEENCRFLLKYSSAEQVSSLAGGLGWVPACTEAA